MVDKTQQRTSSHPRIWGTLDCFVEPGSALGRRVANSTFLEAFLRADPYDGYHFFLQDASAIEALSRWVDERFPALAARGAVQRFPLLALQEKLSTIRYHCMHLSDPINNHARLSQIRNALSAALFPITSLTHSLSYASFTRDFLYHLWSGVSPRDAIVVTSESARLVLERSFAGLRLGYGLSEREFPSPGLVHLPLGVNIQDFPRTDERWEHGGPDNPGIRMRRSLSLGNEPLFLYFGRIDPASKMDMMPLFAAFRRAEALGLPSKEYAVVLAGWAEQGDALPEALCSYAASMGIRALPFPRPDREQRLGLYAAADVFVSPSDNLQETFGLTLAEAGAAGLPVIASDFDGYRDIVAHEHTGLLVPSLGFAHSAETDTQSLWWYDNQYHFKLAQETVVDVPALARALARLGTDKNLRTGMGENGRARVQKYFCWERILERYVGLWDDLAALPLTAQEESRIRRAAHPQRMRFAHYFQGHFSKVLSEERLQAMRVRRTAAGEALYRGALPLYRYSGMEHMVDAQAVRRLLLIARKSVAGGALVRELTAGFETEGLPWLSSGSQGFAVERAQFALLWCLKHDYVEILEG